MSCLDEAAGNLRGQYVKVQTKRGLKSMINTCGPHVVPTRQNHQNRPSVHRSALLNWTSIFWRGRFKPSVSPSSPL